jgi:hypothetical protein
MVIQRAAILGWLSIVTGLSACGGSVEADRFMIKYSGTLQCQPSATTQTRLDAEIAALLAAGAVINGGRCVLDGLPYVAMCGAGSGEAFEVAVSLATVPVARQLGFESADRYPDRKPLACK